MGDYLSYLHPLLTHVNSFFTTLNVPTINRSTYKRREREIGLAVEEVAANSCRMALQDEIDIEKSHGKTPDSDMVGQMLQNSTTCIFIFNNFYLCSTRYIRIQRFIFIFNNAHFPSTST